VLRVAASWVHPALWWEDEEAGADGAGAGPYGERTYYRLVIEGPQVLEVFSTRAGWYLEKIVD
jgi:hypothetical protein